MKMFGANEFGFADLPVKISGTTVSRILIDEKSGCSWCFPHGIETVNSHFDNKERNWKKHRKTQWK